MAGEPERTREARSLAEAALVRISAGFGEADIPLVVLGGLVPDLLCVAADVPHQGTTDVDVQINLEVEIDGEHAVQLEDALRAAGFAPDPERAWRWLDRTQGTIIKVEFLCDLDDQPAQTVVKFRDAGTLGAVNLRGTGYAVRDWVLRDLTASIDGNRAVLPRMSVHDLRRTTATLMLSTECTRRSPRECSATRACGRSAHAVLSPGLEGVSPSSSTSCRDDECAGEGIDMDWNQTSTDFEPAAPPEPSPAAPPDAPPLGTAAHRVLEPASIAPASVPALRRRRRVPVRAAIVAGLVVGIGALGFFLATTLGQLDTARKGEASLRSQLGSTTAILNATRAELVTADGASAAQEQVENYVGVIFTQVGSVQKAVVALGADCPGPACSGAMANVEAAAASFHADGAHSVVVPTGFAAADAEISRAVSEYLSGAKQLVAGIDNGSQSTLLTALRTLSGADALFATAVSDVGNALLLGER